MSSMAIPPSCQLLLCLCSLLVFFIWAYLVLAIRQFEFSPATLSGRESFRLSFGLCIYTVHIPSVFLLARRVTADVSSPLVFWWPGVCPGLRL